MKSNLHTIRTVLPGSIAAELEIEPGDAILAINNEEIQDIFDYQYLIQDENLEVLVRKKDGEEWILDIEKDADEDLGIIFENGLMDEYRSCSNKCIFCFIDQMPPGMRPTLYFKDDDSRLSFLQGNYITLTNLSEHDLSRIIKYHLSPINVSIHTMNPELRVEMLHNRFAGEALKKIDRLYEAGITMNGQIVLCKGINDGEELDFSIREMMKYLPVLQSVSVVPVGLTKYREGLKKLEPFERDDAREVIGIIEKYQKICMETHGTHFVHASDEWYLTAGYEMPEEDRYDGYCQLDNGVGMIRLMTDQFNEALERRLAHPEAFPAVPEREVSLATGYLAYPVIIGFAERIMEHWPQVKIHVYKIRNDFFGERITVSGLLTGQDLKAQLLEVKETGDGLGTAVYLPENVLRAGEEVFLDDMTRTELADALQTRVVTIKSTGHEFLQTLLEEF